MSHVDSPSFGLSVTARRDGSLEAAYVQVTDQKVARTEEVLRSELLLDLDENNEVVGVEILAPVPLERVIELAERLDESQRQAFETFVRSSAPPALVTS
jgi:uncharacterized protein YuzE